MISNIVDIRIGSNETLREFVILYLLFLTGTFRILTKTPMSKLIKQSQGEFSVNEYIIPVRHQLQSGRYLAGPPFHIL